MDGRVIKEELPNQKWRFGLYLNGRDLPLSKVRAKTKFQRMISLVPFTHDMVPKSGIILDGTYLKGSPLYGPGIYIDDAGALRYGSHLDAHGQQRKNWVAPLRCLLLDGDTNPPDTYDFFHKEPEDYWEKPKGLSMVGFNQNGNPIFLSSINGSGRSRKSGDLGGISLRNAEEILLEEKCHTIFLFCDGWKCSAFLRSQWMVPGRNDRAYLYLLAFQREKRGKAPEGPSNFDLLMQGISIRMRVRAENPVVPVRSDPGFPPFGEKTNIVRYLKPGDVVTVYELRDNIWGRIGYNQWVNAKMLV